MLDVIKVKLMNSNTFFSPNNLKLKRGDEVIVSLDNGLDNGLCISEVKKELEDNIMLPIKKIIRRVTLEDKKVIEQNSNMANSALDEAQKIANKLDLQMKFISAYYTFDKKQLYFIYLADVRIDFRELAKKLAQKYKTRIELRQVGVRDKAKMIGGLGPCGLFLCCNSFLTDFNSVSINMAKNQFLALNPSKINGICGRLLCCLNYENDIYTDLKKKFPKMGSIVTIKEGTGKVVGLDIFKNKCKIEISKNNIITVPCEQINEKIK